ncbi:NADH dehydrogenase [Oopsacas minuta]|uniref:NADH dehydrogenase [ubiquinone] 1 alpha subcomplex assembly factor 3 n=1 Tax=Oopsacas minuta TaxID=111878 RepID=A0AAV7JM27_9METZ|nr:NADH dehydrogenase [Oopsacas minuta]
MLRYLRSIYTLNNSSILTSLNVRRTFADLEDIVPERTTISPLGVKTDMSASVVERVNVNGFFIQGKWYLGSVGLLPRHIYNWRVKSFRDISPTNLALFVLLYPHLELVVLGTGTRIERVDREVIRYLRDSGISVEIQDTRHAASTFNYLLDEGRSVAAALIPPRKVTLL